jgi:hypothetical protein
MNKAISQLATVLEIPYLPTLFSKQNAIENVTCIQKEIKRLLCITTEVLLHTESFPVVFSTSKHSYRYCENVQFHTLHLEHLGR